MGALIFKEDHEEDVNQEDGSVKKMTWDEGWQVKQLIDNKKTPPGGIWFAGEKYVVPQVEDMEIGEHTYTWAFATKPKKGCHIVSTGSQIVAGFYLDEKGQNSGNCKKTVLAYAEYL